MLHSDAVDHNETARLALRVAPPAMPKDNSFVGPLCYLPAALVMSFHPDATTATLLHTRRTTP